MHRFLKRIVHNLLQPQGGLFQIIAFQKYSVVGLLLVLELEVVESFQKEATQKPTIKENMVNT